MKFRKKPVVIEAIQWNGSNENDVLRFLDQYDAHYVLSNGSEFSIGTLEGNMIAKKSDWIIRGVKGEFYPCKPDIFEMTYEAVE